MSDLSYSCISCGRDYGNYKNLWAHNKSHHNGVKTVKATLHNEETDSTLMYKCRKCGNSYKHRQSRYTHEKTCDGIVRTAIDLEYEKCRTINLEKVKENLEKEKENLELKIKLQSMNKMDTKTFKAVNKILKDRSSYTMNLMNNCHNTIIINNNFPIESISHENVLQTITVSEKKQILESRMNSLEKMVEIVHCGEHNMFKNIVITNLKDKFA